MQQKEVTTDHYGAIIRLYKYRKSLLLLNQLGFVKVFSENLSDATGINAAQIRRDFSIFGLSGKKRGGYIVETLIQKLDEKLGKDKKQNVIIVGAGNMGKALMHYKGFISENIHILAAFDVDSAKVNSTEMIPILPMSELKEFVKKNHIQVAIVTVPDTAAQTVLNLLVQAGVQGALNFAPIHYTASTHSFIVKHVNIGLELETLIYMTAHLKNTEEGVNQ